LRAAFLYALEKSQQANRGAFRLEHFRTPTLEGVVEELAAATIRQYHEHPGIMKSLIRFIENDTDQAFRENMLAINAQNFEPLIDVLLTFRSEIKHADPRRAILFALLSMGTVIEDRALEGVSMWHKLLPLSDEDLKREVSRSAIAYLRSPG
jgi:hypothetical protein